MATTLQQRAARVPATARVISRCISRPCFSLGHQWPRQQQHQRMQRAAAASTPDAAPAAAAVAAAAAAAAAAPSPQAGTCAVMLQGELAIAVLHRCEIAACCYLSGSQLNRRASAQPPTAALQMSRPKNPAPSNTQTRSQQQHTSQHQHQQQRHSYPWRAPRCADLQKPGGEPGVLLRLAGWAVSPLAAGSKCKRCLAAPGDAEI